MACSSNPLVELLKQSSLTPGLYEVSEAMRSAQLMAVYAGDTPVLLTGSAQDENSIKQAQAFCQSPLFSKLLVKLGILGTVKVQACSGGQLDWPTPCEAIVASQVGLVENQEVTGQLMMINPTPYKELTLLLCVTDEFAKVIDPNAPRLDSGDLVERFVRGDQQALLLQ